MAVSRDRDTYSIDQAGAETQSWASVFSWAHGQGCRWRLQVMLFRTMKADGCSQDPDTAPVASPLPMPSIGQIIIPWCPRSVRC